MTGSDDRPDRVEAILTSPLGLLVTITTAERIGRDPTVRLGPSQLDEWVVECCADLNPHRPEHGEIVRELTAASGELRSSVEWLAATGAASRWFEPLDRSLQVWISPDGGPPDPLLFGPDARRGERTPARIGGPWTATAGEDTDEPAWLRLRNLRVPPDATRNLVLWNLVVDPEARVFEVDGPLAWRWLCRRYPAQIGRGEVTPDWEAVAGDWDGVHVSVGGLVTAHGVAVGSAGSWSTLRGWDAEGTLWLRWAFSHVTSLPGLAGRAV